MSNIESTHPPLAVDLDGTLLKTDVFFESLASALFRRPLQTLALLPTALGGRAPLKRAIAALGPVDVDSLPIREDLTAFLRAEKDRGREVHLVTAADHGLAEQVAARIGVFDSVQGSSGRRNLKGSRKRDFLVQRFPQGFAYVGDSPADLTVWRSAQSVLIAGASPGVARAAERLGKPVEAQFSSEESAPRAWLKALRLHQWAKNLLIFVPLLLAHRYEDPAAVLAAFLGFLCLGLVASGSYILNDLSDLAADRRHRSKRHRPFASGRLKVAHGLAAGPALIGLGLLGGALLAPAFAVWLGAYLALTLAYSLRLKRIALLDVAVLAGLFTLRLAMGAAVIGAALSTWLIAFSMFFFLSLSLAKRHIELVSKAEPGAPNAPIPGRGYMTGDWPLTLGLGLACGVASMVILVLYVNEEAYPEGLYARPGFLWVAPIAVGLWMLRVWLLTWRGRLDDDPVAFAVRDPWSIALGGVLAAGFALASAAFSGLWPG